MLSTRNNVHKLGLLYKWLKFQTTGKQGCFVGDSGIGLNWLKHLSIMGSTILINVNIASLMNYEQSENFNSQRHGYQKGMPFMVSFIVS